MKKLLLLSTALIAFSLPALAEVRQPAGGQVVEHTNARPALDERVDQVRADEAGAAGDENGDGMKVGNGHPEAT